MKALFFGVGGGNDAVSAAFAAVVYQKSSNVEYDEVFVASVASPFHVHYTTNMHEIKDPYFVVDSDIRRKPIGRSQVIRQWSGCDATRLIKDITLRTVESWQKSKYTHVAFQLKDGVSGLFAALQEFVVRFNVGEVFAVDMGGDVLCPDASKHPFMLSPMFDSMSVAAIARLLPEAKFIELGPGTDGEMDQAFVTSLLSGFDKVPIPISDILRLDERFTESALGVNRPGNTIPMFCKSNLNRISARTFHALAHVHHNGATVKWMGDGFTRYVEADPNMYVSTVGAVAAMNPLSCRCKHYRFGESVLGWIIQAGEITGLSGRMPCFEGNTEALMHDGEMYVTAIVPEMLDHCAERIIQASCRKADESGAEYIIVNNAHEPLMKRHAPQYACLGHDGHLLRYGRC